MGHIFIFVLLALLMIGLGGNYILRLIGFVIIGIALIVYFGPEPRPTSLELEQAFNEGWCKGYTWSLKVDKTSGYKRISFDAEHPDKFYLNFDTGQAACPAALLDMKEDKDAQGIPRRQ